MKKFLSCILCIVLMFSVPMISASAANSLKKPTISVSLSGKIAKITIKKVKNAKKYQIYMKKSGESWKKIKTTTSRTYKKSSLSSGKTYYFRVKAVGAKGSTSSFSNAKKVTVKSASSPSNSSVVYITDTGKKYHRSGCSSLRKSKHSISLSNARAQGYTPCARCKP